jgi:alkylated DNA repair protein (DNA oxidative demethylase)
MRNGSTMSVAITCLGWHWYPYRYSRTVDDGDGRLVAPFPAWLDELSRRAVVEANRVDPSVTGGEDPGRFAPDVALVNWYDAGARMGMHADRDEPSAAPVVSLSVGDACVFRFGHDRDRGRPWADVQLESGDLFVFGGPARRSFHGVPKVLRGTADPTTGLDAGRFNVTVRQSGLG